ncbi:MAG: peptidylprolyl isomerase [Pseudomonadota bacterium]
MTDLLASDRGLDVQPGRTVELHFSLLMPSGEEIDSTRNGRPATFVVGDGSLLPGFEAVLIGKTAGFAEQITLPPGKAFGDRNPANVQVLPKARFAGVAEPLEPGLMVSFQSPDGELPGVIQVVYEDTVKIDFNHPLSGSDIVFDVAILKVTETAAT